MVFYNNTFRSKLKKYTKLCIQRDVVNIRAGWGTQSYNSLKVKLQAWGTQSYNSLKVKLQAFPFGSLKYLLK